MIRENTRKPLLFAASASADYRRHFPELEPRLCVLNLCLISAIMTLGVNIQWGYAGLVNFGMMGFTALAVSVLC